MQSNLIGSWSDLASLESWRELSIQIVVAPSAAVVPRIEIVKARTAVLELPLPSRRSGIVAVADPYSQQTYFLDGGQFFVSTQRGLISGWLVLGTVTFSKQYLRIPTPSGGIAAAIEQFVHEFTPERVAKETEGHSSVRLDAAAPEDFFVRGSQLVGADLVSVAIENGILRLELRSHAGVTGVFWVDPEAQTVVKATMDGQPYPPLG